MVGKMPLAARHGGNPEAGGAATRAMADARATELASIIAELKAAGHTSVRKLAAALEARGVPTERGGPWRVTGVHRLLKRIETLP
ncbi:hypothetical protein QO012_004551 [Methylobacterium aerolatum]|uniref:Recombinase domain-containing protein n=1 Tax=Methylobacterium aerolatum TaxID=418708 RepID=A0ABU0I8M0_9HYPH|nr:hypothetical protein [Methylobacterium aerolatum]